MCQSLRVCTVFAKDLNLVPKILIRQPAATCNSDPEEFSASGLSVRIHTYMDMSTHICT